METQITDVKEFLEKNDPIGMFGRNIFSGKYTFDEAYIGQSMTTQQSRAVYDFNKMVLYLMKMGLSPDEAVGKLYEYIGNKELSQSEMSPIIIMDAEAVKDLGLSAVGKKSYHICENLIKVKKPKKRSKKEADIDQFEM